MTAGQQSASASDILSLVRERGINEIVHFTHNRGLYGMFEHGAMLSRSSLRYAESLEFVMQMTWADRSRDIPWHGYNSLSISKVNSELLGRKNRKENQDQYLGWYLLAFDPVILTHAGVLFSTTNNAYTSVTLRAGGREGLEALFAPSVLAYPSRTVVRRQVMTPSCEPTCLQAEVLYPDSLSLEYLRTIYVIEPQQADWVSAIVSMPRVDFVHPRVNIEIRPEVFV